MMHQNSYSNKNYNYEHDEGQSGKKITENNPYYQNKYDSYTPRKRYMKEHQEYDNYRVSYLQKNSAMRECSPYRKDDQNLRTSRVNKKSNIIKQQLQAYAPPAQYSQRNIEKYSRDLYQFDQNDVFKENTQKYVNKTSSRKQKLKNIAIDKDICKNLYVKDEQTTEKNNINWTLKNQKQNVQYKKSFQFDENSILTPRRLNKIKENKNNTQYYEKMSNLQNKISKLQKMTPKRSSTPKNSRIIEMPNYNPTPQNFQPQIQYKQQRYELPSTSRLSLVSQRQIQIMSRVSLGRLVEQQEAQTQVQMIQQLSNKISSKLQSIIRNFG